MSVLSQSRCCSFVYLTLSATDANLRLRDRIDLARGVWPQQRGPMGFKERIILAVLRKDDGYALRLNHEVEQRDSPVFSRQDSPES